MRLLSLFYSQLLTVDVRVVVFLGGLIYCMYVVNARSIQVHQASVTLLVLCVSWLWIAELAFFCFILIVS